METEGFEGQLREAQRPVQPASSRQGTGVRALIVALKPGNAGGAKGCRKVETLWTAATDRNRKLVPARVIHAGDADALVGSLSRTVAAPTAMLVASERR